MIVCSRCRKIIGRSHHSVEKFVTNKMNDPEHLCEECYNEYAEERKKLDTLFFSHDPYTCNHVWYEVSSSKFDVEGCIGVICKGCGHLDCACTVAKEGKEFEADRVVGDRIFDHFYPHEKK